MNNVNAGLAILHIATGAFFATTGARKLFIADVRGKVMHLFDTHHVPLPAQYLVMAGEFLGGLGLLTGTMTHAAAFGLFVIMLGAYVMDTWPAVKAKEEWVTTPRAFNLGFPDRHGPYVTRLVARPTSWSKLFSNALCTPEAQLLIIVATLVVTGAGSVSIDSLIW